MFSDQTRCLPNFILANNVFTELYKAYHTLIILLPRYFASHVFLSTMNRADTYTNVVCGIFCVTFPALAFSCQLGLFPEANHANKAASDGFDCPLTISKDAILSTPLACIICSNVCPGMLSNIYPAIAG